MYSRRLVACAAGLAASSAFAQQQDTITLSTTRLPQPGYELPAAIDAVDARTIREDNPQVNLSESLNRVPGLNVQNRQNYAQDLQVSSRGFGARSTFGVRGVRLIADGIPATMPDGQGQAATFDLASADRVEVLRGPFSYLYGNSSGGVVQVFTADGMGSPTVDVSGYAGSFDLRKLNFRVGGDAGGFNYIANVSRFDTEGYRDHSEARRDQWNAKGAFALAGGKLTLVGSGLHQPDTQDPLGLTRAQMEADPRQADASAYLFDTRKSIRQSQGGATWESQLTHCDSVQARAYGGARQVTQFLSQAGNTPLSSGGVVDLGRAYAGAGFRYTHVFLGAPQPLTASLGVEYDRMEEHRRGFVNENGVAGAPKRDEDNTVSNTDAYAQAEWEFVPRWVLSAGLRASTVRFDSADHFVAGPNPDDSGSVKYSHTNTAAGVMYRYSPQLHFYANAGEGFETPTAAELAYRPGGATGLNFDLQPSKSRQYEVGMKSRPAAGVRANLAIFRVDTRDEIVTNSASGGRTDFKNASRTRRDGFEASLEAKLPKGFEVYAAYTGLRARFTQDFASGSPPDTVPAGRKLPGVPDRTFYAEGVWRHAATGFRAAVELRHVGKVYVDEANSDAASAYTNASLRVGFEQQSNRWRLREFVRVDNVTDRRYVGSVIVAEARSRFFEPAPGRNGVAGIDASIAF
jgi:iron complex outermembrane receptor protein